MVGRILKLTERQASLNRRALANRTRALRLANWNNEAGVQEVNKTAEPKRSKSRDHLDLPPSLTATHMRSAVAPGFSPRSGKTLSVLAAMLALQKAKDSSALELRASKAPAKPVTAVLKNLRGVADVNQAVGGPKAVQVAASPVTPQGPGSVAGLKTSALRESSPETAKPDSMAGSVGRLYDTRRRIVNPWRG